MSSSRAPPQRRSYLSTVQEITARLNGISVGGPSSKLNGGSGPGPGPKNGLTSPVPIQTKQKSASEIDDPYEAAKALAAALAVKPRNPKSPRMRRSTNSPPNNSNSNSRTSHITFGQKDPLSYGTKLPSNFPKYESPTNRGKTIVEQKDPNKKIFTGSIGGAKPVALDGKPLTSVKAKIQKRKIQDYEELKKKCLAENVLFEDDFFPAKDSSLYFSLAGKKNLIWKRPHEIHPDPKFIVGDASRFDVKQGELGNCWFLAAVGNLTIYEELFYNVVPKDNSFVNDYCGIFHFRFWQYGKWIDVVVDDRLPCDPISGGLVFMHSYTKNEFWGALMEKAYAKVYGSYEALDSGSSNEALQDFCGGIVELAMTKDCPDVAKVIETGFKNHSFICASVEGVSGKTEAITPDGLVHGHAYTVTAFKRIQSNGKSVALVRIRNPWGSETEWNGAWSDQSKEWNTVSPELKKELKLKNRNDGEFWMSCDDFKYKFYKLDICNLSPSLYKGVAVAGKKWNESDFEGKWIPHATAGGCGNYMYKEPFSYAKNPQYIVEFDTPDSDGDPTKCTVLIGLVQKNRRAKKKEGATSLVIGYAIYTLKGLAEFPNPLDLEFFKRNTARLVGDSGKFTNSRVVNARFELEPGKYLIVPSTFDPNQEGEFVLRVFSESVNRISENGGETKLDDDSDDETDKKDKKPKPTTEYIKDTAIAKLFDATAGSDGEIGWAKLKQLLDSCFKREFKFAGFNAEICRSMVALLDRDRSGKIGPEEFEELWTSILKWKNAFKKYDEDHSNNMSAGELRNAMKGCGVNLSNRTLETLVLRYGNDNVISFEDFMACAVKVSGMIGTFKEFQSKDKGLASPSATFTLEDWLEKTIYS